MREYNMTDLTKKSIELGEWLTMGKSIIDKSSFEVGDENCAANNRSRETRAELVWGKINSEFEVTMWHPKRNDKQAAEVIK